MTENAEPPEEPFTLREVFADALRALREDWLTHLGWNFVWAALGIVSCCGLTILMAGGLAGFRIATHSDRGGVGEIVTALLVYAVLLPLFALLYASHQSVTMLLVRARLRDAPLALWDAVRAGLARTPAFAAHAVVRWLIDFVPLVVPYAIGFGLAGWAFGGGDDALRMVAGVIIALLYVVALVYSFGVRGFVGLSYACVAAGTGPLVALDESVRLLRGRRMQFIGKRVLLLLVWMFGYALCLGPFLAATFARSTHAVAESVALATLPLVLGFYGLAWFLIVLDAALEAAYHTRLTRPLDAAALAETFA